VSGTAPTTPPAAQSSTPRDGAGREKRWLRSTQLAGIIGTLLAVAGLVVGILAWRSPVSPTARSAPTSSADTSRPPVPTTGGDTASGAPAPPSGRFLTDLRPDTGGGNVQRTGAHSLLMKCGTGESDDRYREVTYLVPQVSYRSFVTTAAATGERDTRVQVLLLIDDRVVTDPVVSTGGSTRVEWTGEGATRLTLRLFCDPGAVSVTFVDPSLAKG
jgi:hypothetical protein